MRRLRFAILLAMVFTFAFAVVVPVHAVVPIAFVGVTMQDTVNPGTSTTVSFTSVAGDTYIVEVSSSAAAAGNVVISVTDSGGDTFVRKVSVTPAASRIDEAWALTTPGTGTLSTTFTVNYVAGVTESIIAVADYSGVVSYGVTATASQDTPTTNPSVSAAVGSTSSWVVCGFGAASAVTYTAQNGVLRRMVTGTAISAALIDNTGSLSETCSATTNAAAAQAETLLELRPAAVSSTTTVTCPQQILIGQSVVCQAKVVGNNPTGTVAWTATDGSFTGSPCVLLSGKCTVTYNTPFTVEQVTITASYSGDTANNPSSGTEIVNINSGNAALGLFVLLMLVVFGVIAYYAGFGGLRKRRKGGGRKGRGFF